MPMGKKRGPYKITKNRTPEEREAIRLMKLKRTQEWRARNKDKVRAGSEKWRLSNRERINAYKRREYAANPDHFRKLAAAHRAAMSTEEKAAYKEYLKRYHAEHPNQVKSAKKKYADQHRDENRLRAKEWLAEHPEVRRACTKRRRAAAKGAGVTDEKAIAAWERRWRRSKVGVRCYWCNGLFLPIDCHMDHIKPMGVSIKAGAPWHSMENVCIACAPCNLKKHSKHPAEWNKHLDQPTLL